jgi:hypothetical protein
MRQFGALPRILTQGRPKKMKWLVITGLYLVNNCNAAKASSNPGTFICARMIFLCRDWHLVSNMATGHENLTDPWKPDVGD